MTKRESQWLGYEGARRLGDGRWIAVRKIGRTFDLFVGLDHFHCQCRYCYSLQADALYACRTWNGNADPPGDWIALLGHPERHGELGPGAADWPGSQPHAY